MDLVKVVDPYYSIGVKESLVELDFISYIFVMKMRIRIKIRIRIWDNGSPKLICKGLM